MGFPGLFDYAHIGEFQGRQQTTTSLASCQSLPVSSSFIEFHAMQSFGIWVTTGDLKFIQINAMICHDHPGSRSNMKEWAQWTGMIGLIGMSIAQGVENIKGYDDTDQDGPHCEGPLQDFEGAKWCNSEWNLWSILSHIEPYWAILIHYTV